MEMGKSFITRLVESSELSCHIQSPQLGRKRRVTLIVTMYREVMMIKGAYCFTLISQSSVKQNILI